VTQRVVTDASLDDSFERAELERFHAYRSTRSRDLRNELVEGRLPLAHGLARRFANRSEPLDDLEQVAILGLLKAIEGFDPDRGTAFSAFAIPTILGELRRHFRDRGWMVRVPRRLQDLRLRLDPLVSDLSQRLGRSPTTSEVALAAEVDEEDVLEAMDAGNRYRPTSLDIATDSPRHAAALDLAVHDEDLDMIEDRAVLWELLQRLSPREQRVLYLRFYEDRTQSEIAAEIGVSQMQVSRVLSRCLEALGCADTEPR
jgi:RNA polymerase sigma-B factor